MVSRDILFLNALPVPALFLITAGGTLFLLFSYRRFSIPSHFKFRVILGLLRALLFLSALFMILDPYRNHSGDSDWVGILVDTSKSMAVQDAGSRDTRFEILKAYFKKDGVWASLAKSKIKKYQAVDSEVYEGNPLSALEPREAASRLVKAVRQIDSTFRGDGDLLGWILFSDGAATDRPERLKQIIPDPGFPWIAVDAGQDEAVLNVRLKHPALKAPVFVGDKVPVRLEWESNFPLKTAALVTVTLDQKPLIQKNIALDDFKIDFEFAPAEAGIHALEMSLAPLPGEGSAQDNKIRVLFKVLPRTTRVFYAESFYKDRNFFKEALEEDAGFQVSFASSVIGFSRKFRVPYIKDPLYGFPKTREELFQYDAVVLSDVKRSLLSAQQVEALRELVEKEGGVFVMVGGMDSFGDGGYVGTAIEKMLPVEISEEYKQNSFLKSRGVNENPFRALLAPEADKNPLMQLDPDPGKNKSLWETMPLLGGYNYVGRVKPGAELLLQHPSETGAYGPRPILAVQNFGEGKAVAFTSDITPNWGQWFQEWKDEKEGWVYAKFWRNFLKNLTENKLRRRSSLVGIQREPLLAETGRPVTFTLNLPRAEKSGPSELRLELIREETALFHETFKNPETQKVVWSISSLDPGDYRLTAFFARDGEAPLKAEHPFAVHSSREEAGHLNRDLEFLKALAEQTQGVYLPFNKIEKLDDAVASLRKVQLRKKSSPLWNHPLFYILFLSTLGLDWFIRKKQGME